LGSPRRFLRFRLKAVAKAFVVLGVLLAARAGKILAAQRPLLEAADIWAGCRPKN
jgi:hypothetical protein